MSQVGDRVKDTTTTTGTGAVTMSGTAPTGYRTLATALGSGSQSGIPYVIELTSEWEVGLGTFNGTTGLTRDVVLASSNAGALVSFSAGTKNVWVDLPADLMITASNARAMFLTNYGV